MNFFHFLFTIKYLIYEYFILFMIYFRYLNTLIMNLEIIFYVEFVQDLKMAV